DGLHRGVTHAVLIVLWHLAEVNIHPAQIATLARNVQDVARLRVDRALDAPVGKVGVHEHIHDTPRVFRHAADMLAADRVAHEAARAITPHHVLRANHALLPGVLASGAAHGHGDRIVS